MRHAMLICMHTNYKILQMFIDLYDDERYDFYILIDKKVSIDANAVLDYYPTKSKIYFCPRINISWGGYSQIEANLLLYEISSKRNYDYYHFFQGSDFPVKTRNYVDSFFSKNKGKQFVNIYPSRFAKNKCGYYHFFTNNKWFRDNIILKGANKLSLKIQKLLHVSRNTDLELYAGSALTSLTHDCVMYILSKRKEIHQRFSYTMAADEVFLQTLIANSSFKDQIYKFERTSNANVRYIDWEDYKNNSPRTFLSCDYTRLTTCDDDICFARKFNESVDIDIVEQLYDYLQAQMSIEE